ncbi:MAG: CPBP family intramembrane metalloprotease [Verrucomicrobia bacterium]|nr:CPBP family intramembrane metalloprotease [Verrucomicrobiota bacterium]
MKRSWPTYIAVFIGMIVLFGVANAIQAKVLNGEAAVEEAEETLPWIGAVSVVLVFGGAHFVAMFAATPGWRRRSLYVTRLPWGALAGFIMIVVLFLLPEFAAVLGAGDDATTERDNITIVMPEEPPRPVGQSNAPAEVPAGDAIADEETGPEGHAVMEFVGEPRDAVVLTTLPQELIRLAASTGVLVIFLFVARSIGENYWRGLGFGRERFWRHIGTGAAAYVAFTWAIMPVAQTAVALLLRLFDAPIKGHEAVEEFRETALLSTRLALVLGITVRAPLFEEIVFRGMLFQTIKRYAGAWPGIVASAAIFAALHGGWFVVINIFFLGLLFGYLFDKTGSIVPGIVLHFLFNSTTTVYLLLTS